MNLRITKLDTSDSGFSAAFQSLRSGATIPDPAVTTSVREIINRVREHGDSALLRYARDLDGAAAATAAELEVPRARLDRARDALPDPVNQALAKAAQRIRAYHEQELAHAQRAFEFSDGDGNLCGQRVTAVARAGLYVPGGRAAYPSSVLMSAIPARIAGVGEVQKARNLETSVDIAIASFLDPLRWSMKSWNVKWLRSQHGRFLVVWWGRP